MKVLFVSSNLGILKNMLNCGSLIGFIPTAGEVYEDPYFVREDRQRLLNMGYRVQNIDITNEIPATIKKQLNEVEALFVAGGNTFYLMQQLHEKKLIESINQFMQSDRLYIGASAGCAICSPSLEPYISLDDMSKAPRLASLAGLGITEFVVLPHYGNMKYLDNYHGIMKEYGEKYRMVLLRDDEAIVLFSARDYEVRRSEAVPLICDNVL